PHRVDLAIATLGQRGEPVTYVADDTRRKRAPPRREQQLDPRLPVLDHHGPDQPHVDHRNALLLTTWGVEIGQSVEIGVGCVCHSRLPDSRFLGRTLAPTSPAR